MLRTAQGTTSLALNRLTVLRLFGVNNGHGYLEAAVTIPDRYLDWPGLGDIDRNVVQQQKLLRRDGVGREGEGLELNVAAAVRSRTEGPAQSSAIRDPLCKLWSVASGGLWLNLLPHWTDRL